ncbi:VirB8/TrbF family protein [Rickettsiales bacterium]|nr:VirB8/TrbF family protein [Rickettsiales bacterium]
MDRNTEEIAKKIENGSYFEDAYDWYSHKYLLPIVERSYILIVAAVIGVAFFHIIINLQSFASSVDQPPVIIYVDNSTDEFSYIHPISKADEDPQQAVIRHVISDYIKTREEYIPSKMYGKNYKAIVRKIKSTSTKSLLNEYKNYMSKLNPNSPFVRYKDHIKRTIKIKKFRFLNDSITSGKARAIIEAKEFGGGKKPSTTLWSILVHFRAPNVSVIAKTGAPLRFLVTYYKVTPVE